MKTGCNTQGALGPAPRGAAAQGADRRAPADPGVELSHRLGLVFQRVTGCTDARTLRFESECARVLEKTT